MSSVIYSVEDDKDIAKIINKTLSKQGYDVVSFYDGTSLLRSKPFLSLLLSKLRDQQIYYS